MCTRTWSSVIQSQLLITDTPSPSLDPSAHTTTQSTDFEGEEQSGSFQRSDTRRSLDECWGRTPVSWWLDDLSGVGLRLSPPLTDSEMSQPGVFKSNLPLDRGWSSVTLVVFNKDNVVSFYDFRPQQAAGAVEPLPRHHHSHSQAGSEWCVDQAVHELGSPAAATAALLPKHCGQNLNLYSELPCYVPNVSV